MISASRRDAPFGIEHGIPTGCHDVFAPFSTERNIPCDGMFFAEVSEEVYWLGRTRMSVLRYALRVPHEERILATNETVDSISAIFGVCDDCRGCGIFDSCADIVVLAACDLAGGIGAGIYGFAVA